MDDHPLVRFADGPAGRRARLIGTGKDVWEVIATVRDNDTGKIIAALQKVLACYPGDEDLANGETWL